MLPNLGGLGCTYLYLTQYGCAARIAPFFSAARYTISPLFLKLEDLKVLRRSPDLLNNVTIGQSTTDYNGKKIVLPYMGVAAILVKNCVESTRKE